MGCTTVAPGVNIHFASDHFLRKEIRYCPMDQCKTEMVVRYERWYGETAMCCRCGDTWQDGDLGHRPLKRGWRNAAVAYHRELWDRATHGKPPTMQELYPDWEMT